MRLDKYLAETAQCTRSEAKTLLQKGRVTVNGAVCKKGDTQLKDSDTVAVDGQPLAYQQFVYLMLNKPEGVVSASTDKRDTTVVDLNLAFSNCPGPLFLIGTVGVGFFGMPAFGYLLWLSAFLGAVATGILFRRKKSVPAFHSVSVPSCQTLTEVLSASVADALRTILLIGGYLILFAVLSAAMEQAGLFSLLSRLLFFLPLSTETLRGFCSGILEMTNGAHLLSLSPDGLRLRLTLVAFLVSFGGLSILGQTFGVLAAMPISKKDYIKGKLINALFSSLSFFLLYPFFYPYAQKEVPAFFSLTETSFTLSFLWLLPSLFFLAVLCYAISRRG